MPKKVKKMSPRSINVNRNKGFAITAAVLVVILVVVLGILIFTGGNDSKREIVAQESEENSNGSEESATPTTATTTGLSIEQVEVPPLSINRRRNPFRPLLDQKSRIECALEEVAPITPLGGGIVTVPPELERGHSGGPATEAEVVSTIVTLEDIFEEDGKLYASITVADQLFGKVVQGETFAESYKLLVLSRESGATILFGDERFTFFVGQSIYW